MKYVNETSGLTIIRQKLFKVLVFVFVSLLFYNLNSSYIASK